MYELDYKGPRRVGYQPAQLPHCHPWWLLREDHPLEGSSESSDPGKAPSQIAVHLVSGAVITFAWVTLVKLSNKP